MEPDITLRLLGGFVLRHRGRPIDLQLGAQRLVALLAIERHPVSRAHAVGRLWPDVTDDRASANLRSTLWRVRHTGVALIASVDQHNIGLMPTVQVDLHDIVNQESLLVDDYVERAVIRLDDSLSEDLLPGWDEDWVVVERERVRQLRLHTLEAIATRLVERGRWREAIEVAFAAVREEPLRETAQRCLIEAHIAEGNVVEAVRQYQSFRALLRRELGVEPSVDLRTRLREVQH
ncbi:MAG: AfsR/SARP family transcriptional regulator [Actinomycetota bacterium]